MKLTIDIEAESPEYRSAANGVYKALCALRHGWDCWCEVALGNPNLRGEHTPQCVKAREAILGFEQFKNSTT